MSSRDRRGQLILQGEGNATKDRLVYFQGVNLVGRNPAKTTLTIKDRSISEIHAKVIVRNGAIRILDARSKNGVYINDLENPIEPDIEVTIDPKIDVVYFAQIRGKFVPDEAKVVREEDENAKEFVGKKFKKNVQGGVSIVEKEKETSKDKSKDAEEENLTLDSKAVPTKEKTNEEVVGNTSKDQKKTKKNQKTQKEVGKQEKVDKEKTKALQEKLKLQEELLKAIITEEETTNGEKQKIKEEPKQKEKQKEGQKQKQKQKLQEKKPKLKPKKQSKEKNPNKSTQKEQQKKAKNKKGSKEKHNQPSNQPASKPPLDKTQVNEQKGDKEKEQQQERVMRPSVQAKPKNQKRTESDETKVKGVRQKKNKSLNKSSDKNPKSKPIINRKKLPENLNESLNSHPRRSILQKTALISGFTMTFKPTIKITITENWRQRFDVLVMEKYSRTFKLLYAICLGVPVVSLNWVLECEYRRGITGVERFVLQGPEKDLIANSVLRARDGEKVFKDIKFYLIEGDEPFHMPVEQIEALIEVGGGTVTKKLTKKQENPKDILFIMRNSYTPQDLKHLKKLQITPEKLYTVQLILDSCLRQQINWTENKVKKQ